MFFLTHIEKIKSPKTREWPESKNKRIYIYNILKNLTDTVLLSSPPVSILFPNPIHFPSASARTAFLLSWYFTDFIPSKAFFSFLKNKTKQKTSHYGPFRLFATTLYLHLPFYLQFLCAFLLSFHLSITQFGIHSSLLLLPLSPLLAGHHRKPLHFGPPSEAQEKKQEKMWSITSLLPDKTTFTIMPCQLQLSYLLYLLYLLLLSSPPGAESCSSWPVVPFHRTFHRVWQPGIWLGLWRAWMPPPAEPGSPHHARLHLYSHRHEFGPLQGCCWPTTHFILQLLQVAACRPRLGASGGSQPAHDDHTAPGRWGWPGGPAVRPSMGWGELQSLSECAFLH